MDNLLLDGAEAGLNKDEDSAEDRQQEHRGHADLVHTEPDGSPSECFVLKMFVA